MKLRAIFLIAWIVGVATVSIKLGRAAPPAAHPPAKAHIEKILTDIAHRQIGQNAWLSVALQGNPEDSSSLALPDSNSLSKITSGVIYLYAEKAANKALDTDGINLMMRSAVNRALGYPVEMKIDWISGVTESTHRQVNVAAIALIAFVAAMGAGGALWTFQRLTQPGGVPAKKSAPSRSTVAIPASTAMNISGTLVEANEVPMQTTSVSEFTQQRNASSRAAD